MCVPAATVVAPVGPLPPDCPLPVRPLIPLQKLRTAMDASTAAFDKAIDSRHTIGPLLTQVLLALVEHVAVKSRAYPQNHSAHSIHVHSKCAAAVSLASVCKSHGMNRHVCVVLRACVPVQVTHAVPHGPLRARVCMAR